jgi:hypothetical protein
VAAATDLLNALDQLTVGQQVTLRVLRAAETPGSPPIEINVDAVLAAE